MAEMAGKIRELNSSVRSSMGNDPMFVAGLAFLGGYLIGTGRVDRLAYTGKSLVQGFGRFVNGVLHDSFESRMGQWRSSRSTERSEGRTSELS